jgi:hypothetical protein
MNRRSECKPPANGERPANLLFWFRNGMCGRYDARVDTDLQISIGRTDSERGLGFLVLKGKDRDDCWADFVLDKDQVAELAAFLQRCMLPALRKPLGRKKDHVSVAALTSPKTRLHSALLQAAMIAHPGWRRVEEDDWEADGGTPGGTRLIAWFKKKHPRAAARIERDLTKALWKGE